VQGQVDALAAAVGELRAPRDLNGRSTRKTIPSTVRAAEADLPLNATAEELVAVAQDRPRRRSECEQGPRPCPWVGCRYNLYLDVNKAGSLVFNFPGRAPDEVPPAASCALDLAAFEEGMTLTEVGGLFNLCRERVRQVQVVALAKLGIKRRVRNMAEDLAIDVSGRSTA
jgi:hypothetical protein